MKTLLALILLAALAVGAYLYLAKPKTRPDLEQAGRDAASAAEHLKDAVKDRLKGIQLNTPEIKEELERTGKVVRKKAQEVGAVIVDATSDTRITAAIKAKLVKEADLSALRISVDTTGGVVTLAGSVSSAEDVARAMKIALDTEGVKEVISTLQVKAAK